MPCLLGLLNWRKFSHHLHELGFPSHVVLGYHGQPPVGLGTPFSGDVDDHRDKNLCGSDANGDGLLLEVSVSE